MVQRITNLTYIHALYERNKNYKAYHHTHTFPEDMQCNISSYIVPQRATTHFCRFGGMAK
jgi:hypothetical protein